MHALGVAIASADAAGLVPGRAAPGAPSVRVERVSAQTLRAAWPDEDARRIVDRAVTVDHHPLAGYRILAAGFGAAVVAADGSSVRCATDAPDAQDWRRQRLLFSQALPLAATLRGMACMHASAVALDGAAVALVGASGSGKSSVAAALLDRGAEFVTDDVLAVGADGLAHPGPRFAALGRAEHGSLGPEGRAALGPPVARGDKLMFAPCGPRTPLPLTAILVVDRGAHPAPALRPIEGAGRLLLAASFVNYLDDPAVLASLLDACASLAAAVPVLRLLVPEGAQRASVAALVASSSAG